jgi:site-specific DNA recombinase
MKPAAYNRVSSQEQLEKGWNLEEDRRLAQELADEKGWGQVEMFDDGGLQGDDVDRPELRRLLDSLDDYTHLIVRDLDRYARHLPTYLDLRERVRQTGVQVWEFTNPRGPVGFELADNLKACIAEDEKRKIGVRVKQASAARRRAGLPVGPASLGYAWKDKRLVKVPERAKLVERIFTDFVRGVSQRKLAQELVAEGVPTMRGGDWSQSHVSRVLGNPRLHGQGEGPGRRANRRPARADHQRGALASRPGEARRGRVETESRPACSGRARPREGEAAVRVLLWPDARSQGREGQTRAVLLPESLRRRSRRLPHAGDSPSARGRAVPVDAGGAVHRPRCDAAAHR